VGYPQQVQVDPARLTAVAGEVREAATLLTNAASAAQGHLAVAGGPEWTSVAASKAAQDAWSAFLAKLAASVQGLGSDLDTAAKTYTQTDQAAAHRVGAAGGRNVAI
jgi:uncharacterized protein YukE